MSDYTFALPDTIMIYRLPVLAICQDETEIAHQVAVTVVHEIGHHFGLSDDDIERIENGV
jgi:predicted Zn-dependent protease with MMP-like domain